MRFIGILVIVLFAGIFAYGRLDTQRAFVEIADQKFVVDVMRTTEEKQKGLSGRESLAADEGMLFVYGQEFTGLGFWMKDMLFSIDIIWLDSTGNIVEIHKNIAPDTYPSTFRSEAPAQYVLEVRAGESSEHGFAIGGQAMFSEDFTQNGQVTNLAL